jgi:hypothetical protein
MIQRFRQVAPGLYRGSAPSPSDVAHLQKEYGIKKIVSLDERSGERISKACKLLGINQIKLYIDDRQSILKVLHHNLKDLLIEGGPTFVHCYHGKDRTGLVIAMFQCKYLGMNPEEAIQQAKKLGFGIGVPPSVVNLYEKLIKSCKPVKDENHADIVSNEREPYGDNRDTYLDHTKMDSFAPYLDPTQHSPIDMVYNPINDQSSTRENYQDYKNVKENSSENQDIIPQVGIYNNDAGIYGEGPSINSGGFIYD